MCTALHKESCSVVSLCNLCVLCVSVVYFCSDFITTETQRTQRLHRDERYHEFLCKANVHGFAQKVVNTTHGSGWIGSGLFYRYIPNGTLIPPTAVGGYFKSHPEDRSSYFDHNGLCTKSLDRAPSLCHLCVLCVSVVDEFRVKPHHRDTEDTEVAQRNPRTRTFCHLRLPDGSIRYWHFNLTLRKDSVGRTQLEIER